MRQWGDATIVYIEVSASHLMCRAESGHSAIIMNLPDFPCGRGGELIYGQMYHTCDAVTMIPDHTNIYRPICERLTLPNLHARFKPAKRQLPQYNYPIQQS